MAANARFSKAKVVFASPFMKHRRPYQLPPPVAAAPLLLPVGVEAAAVLARRQAMIDAGIHPVLAGQLALSAAGHQALRDRREQKGPRSKVQGPNRKAEDKSQRSSLLLEP